jgi:hypothetical protein
MMMVWRFLFLDDFGDWIHFGIVFWFSVVCLFCLVC